MYYDEQVISESDMAIAIALADWFNTTKKLSIEDIAKLQWQIQLIDDLNNRVVDVEFLKVDGSKRVMKCTLNPELIPLDKMPNCTYNDNEYAMKVLTVYEVDLQAWRSFRLGNVIGFSFTF